MSKLPFALPALAENPGAWGPSAAAVPASVARVPYAPYSKSDRVGRVADWTAPIGPDGAPLDARRHDDRTAATGRRHGARAAAAAAAAGPDAALAAAAAAQSAFAYLHPTDDDASFSVVDRAAAPVRRPGARSAAAAPRPVPATAVSGPSSRAAGRPGSAAATAAAAAQPKTAAKRPGTAPTGSSRYGDRQVRVRDPSIKVGPTWTIVEELDFNRLNKLYLNYTDPEDIAIHGSVQYVDRAYERINTKSEKPLQIADKTFHNVTASDDPVIQGLAKSAEGLTIFASDVVLAALMNATRSVNSFDIVITRRDNLLFLDKRDGSVMDLVTVNENAADPPMDGPDRDTNINNPQALAHEAAHINRSYSQQVLRESERVEFGNPNPFAHGEPVQALASVAYRYRRWNLAEVSLVVRTQIDAAVHQPGAGAAAEQQPEGIVSSSAPEKDTIFATVKALNEFDSRAQGAGGAPDWRQKFDSQRGAVMATEIKNNANKLCRWATEAILAGVDQLRLGFVSRTNPRDRKRHAILGSVIFKPDDLASQINLDIGSGWGIVKAFTDLCFAKLANGKYVLLRDPNKPMLRLYQVVSAAAAAQAAAGKVATPAPADE
ncbi:hypothetical protein HK105_200337 [Polyrhizophydium stewartii]|uniref:Eukaryotic translation initiation factor 3 subunit D n=1 Tax=Polyrhizophydium stewartii TaxID=2732419 RepID=A0ABR4NL66_9FUNG